MKIETAALQSVIDWLWWIFFSLSEIFSIFFLRSCNLQGRNNDEKT